MKNIPTITQQKNIAKFASQWADWNMVACKESCRAASRYLDMFRDWLWENMPDEYSQLVGIIEYTRHHDRENVSVKRWRCN